MSEIHVKYVDGTLIDTHTVCIRPQTRFACD